MTANINWVTAFVTIFTIIDPFGLIPIFLGVAGKLEKKQRIKTIFLSCTIALIVSSFFLFLGKPLLKVLGLSFESFYIAGGILLFLVALDMLFARPRRTRNSPEEQDEITDNYLDISVFPLAIPMLAGPGTIATIIMFASSAKNILDYAIIFGCFAVSLLICMFSMLFSEFILKILKNTGLNVIDRLMGMILSAMAVQFVLNALKNLSII